MKNLAEIQKMLNSAKNVTETLEQVDAAECEYEATFIPWGNNQMLFINDESPELHRWFAREISSLRTENAKLNHKIANRDLNLRYLRRLIESAQDDVRRLQSLLEDGDDDWCDDADDDWATYTQADMLRELDGEGGEA